MAGLAPACTGTWATGSRSTAVLRAQVARPKARNGNRVGTTMMGNNAANGPFTPIVNATRAVMGVKSFNTLRGQGISYHSQVIKEFCGVIGASKKQAQAVIRLAKKNGEKLGFLS